jgi:hypothetical protein
MTQATGTKLMGQPMGASWAGDKGAVRQNKQTVIQQMAAIGEVFGDDRGLLKFLLSLGDEELSAIQKFAQAYDAGTFSIDVIVDAPAEKPGIFP